jgi:hypothetical protein
LPHCASLPEPVFRERLSVAQMQVVHAVADRARAEDARRGTSRLTPLDLFVANLVDMFVAALTAPVSVATRSAARAAGAMPATPPVRPVRAVRAVRSIR